MTTAQPARSARRAPAGAAVLRDDVTAAIRDLRYDAQRAGLTREPVNVSISRDRTVAIVDLPSRIDATRDSKNVRSSCCSPDFEVICPAVAVRPYCPASSHVGIFTPDGCQNKLLECLPIEGLGARTTARKVSPSQ